MLRAFQTAIGAGAADTTTTSQATARATTQAPAVHAPPPHAPTECAECRLAVLPFRVPQDDDDLRSLEEGAARSIDGGAVRLARLARDFEPPRAAVWTRCRSLAVGQKLEVERLLTGSVMRAGDDIRITAQLVDASDGAVCWSLTSNHRWESAVALQDTVCREIRAGLDEHRAASLVVKARPASTLKGSADVAPSMQKLLRRHTWSRFSW